MTANGLYLLTALLLHLTISITGLSRTTHFELIYLLFRVHIPAILLCIITIIVSLFCEITTSLFTRKIIIYSFKIDIKIIPKVLLIITLILVISRLLQSWLYTYQYFSTLRVEKIKRIQKNKRNTESN